MGTSDIVLFSGNQVEDLEVGERQEMSGLAEEVSPGCLKQCGGRSPEGKLVQDEHAILGRVRARILIIDNVTNFDGIPCQETEKEEVIPSLRPRCDCRHQNEELC